jgi:hypothetical protein
MKRSLFVVLVLALAGLACDLMVGGPTPPASPVPFSTEAAGEVPNAWQQAATSVPSGGDVSVTFTEQQLTSFVILKLNENENAILKDPQVFLRDGKIQLYGTAEANGVRTSALIVIAVTVSAEGNVVFTAEKADFGPLPVPSALLDSVSTTLNEALTGSAGSLASGFKVTQLAIADGQMAITGKFTR